MSAFISLRFLVVFTLLLGVLYPLSMTGIGVLLFPTQSQGSLIVERGQVKGSRLIGQDFSLVPGYFHGRPSATTPAYNPGLSGASNLSPVGPAFKQLVSDRRTYWNSQAGSPVKDVPLGLLTASASGLDPHLSLEGVLFQLPIISKVRGIPEKDLTQLVQAHTQSPFWPWDPPAYVNILELNLSLDLLKPRL